jgi:hypothetical protein
MFLKKKNQNNKKEELNSVLLYSLINEDNRQKGRRAYESTHGGIVPLPDMCLPREINTHEYKYTFFSHKISESDVPLFE